MSENVGHSDDQTLEPGTIIGGFRIVRELGRGAMGIVYLAEQTSTGAPVAMKILLNSLAKESDNVSLFLNEARSAATLSHPNIIQAIDYGEADGVYFFCMEYVDGISMLDIINANGRIDLEDTITLCLQVAKALDYGFSNFHLTHGDIKPENIMITDDGEAKLADFGLAKVDGNDYNGSKIMLTPFYASPELISGKLSKGDCRADIYAFGATIYHALAGSPPFNGQSSKEVLDKHLNENPEPLKLRCPEASVALSNFIARTLDKNPARRPQNWKEVISTLSAFIKTKPAPSSAAGTSQPKKAIHSQGSSYVDKHEAKKGFGILHCFAVIIAIVIFLVGIMFFVFSDTQNTLDIEQPSAVEVPVKNIVNEVPSQTEAQTAEAVQTTTEEIQNTEETEQNATEAKQNNSNSEEKNAEAAQSDTAQPSNDAVLSQPSKETEVVQKDEKTNVPPASQPDFTRKPVDLTISLELSQDAQTKLHWYRAAEFLARMKFNLDSSTPVEPMFQALQEWLDKAETIEEVHLFMEFIKKEVLPALDLFKPLVIENRKEFIGISFMPQRNEKYTVKDIKENSVVLSLQRPGLVTQEISWEKSKHTGLLLHFAKAMLQSQTSTDSAKKAALAYIIFTGNSKTIAQHVTSYVDVVNANNWLLLTTKIQEMLPTSRQKGMTNLINLSLACQNYDHVRAALLASTILHNSNSDLSEADKNTISNLLSQVSFAVPQNQGGLLMQQALELKSKMKNQEAILLALAAKNMFGKANFPEKSDIDSCISSNFNELDKPSSFDAKKTQKYIPFISDNAPMTDAIVAFNADTLFKKHITQNLYSQLKPLSLFAMGDWASADEIFKNNPIEKFELPQARELQDSVNKSLNFARLLYQYAHSSMKPNAFLNPEEVNANVLALEASAKLLMNTYPKGQENEISNWNPNNSIDGSPAKKRLLCYMEFILAKQNKNDLILKALADATQNPVQMQKLGFEDARLQNCAKRVFTHVNSQLLNSSMLDKELPWAFLHAWFENSSTPEGLDGRNDALLKELLDDSACNWPIQAGEALHTWLLYRCAYELASGDLQKAVELTQYSLSLHIPCVQQYRLRHLILYASLLQLAHKTGGISMLYLNARSSFTIAQFEQRALNELETMLNSRYKSENMGDLIQEIPTGKPAVFWFSLLGTALNYAILNENHPFEIKATQYNMPQYQNVLLNSFMKYIK